KGPAVTRYELQMPPGISVRKIADKADDIAYSMASNGKVRIETPIPGKQAVGIEIPNNTIEVVSLRELIESREFNMHSSPLAFALGKDIAGKNIFTDLAKMPHLLVAGATNSGKSSCLNALITSIIYRSSPLDVRFILVDPKRVEFTSYTGLPHLLLEHPITEPEQALNAFEWAIEESEKRFELFVSYKVRDISDFNNMSVVKNGDVQKLPYIVIVVDELADLMSQAKRDFEDKIRSIAQKSRAAGIHLVLATQRPSVDVITGTIKANLPSRIAFSVTSFADSKTILDQGGAEKLLGRGDMLYAPVDKPEPFRVQGAYVTNDEVYDVVNFIKENNESFFDKELEERILKNNEQETNDGVTVANFIDDADPNLPNIMRMFLELGQASTTLIQRRFRYGYAKAARIMDQLELKKYISAFDGTNKPRKVLMTPEQFEEEFGEPFDLQEDKDK
ncbi:MAG TPA: DNA translocase FtsK, partial [Clostridia bacterium]